MLERGLDVTLVYDGPGTPMARTKEPRALKPNAPVASDQGGLADLSFAINRPLHMGNSAASRLSQRAARQTFPAGQAGRSFR